MTQSIGQNSSPLVLAADLGGTHLRVALIDATGAIHSQVKQKSPKGDSPMCVVEALLDAARECGADTEHDVVAASVMVPGTVDKQNAVVVRAPNLPCLNNFALKAVLEEKSGRPVVLENDANAAAVGEMWLGAARGCKDVICITLGTGVGGGVILDGKLWRGSQGSAGEVGHATVEPFGSLKCKCGNTGCLEMFASATAIVRMAKEGLQRYPKSMLAGQSLTAVGVYEAGRKGDELAIEVFRVVGTYLGVGVANLINLFNPEIIVIGGGVSGGWDLFKRYVYEQVTQRAFGSQQANIKIVPAECGDNAGLLGAARLAFDELKIAAG
jgi:glucokinase